MGSRRRFRDAGQRKPLSKIKRISSIDLTGCVLYNDFLRQRSGSKALDLRGFGTINHGTITGATWVPDGLATDGLDDKAVILFDSSLDILDGNNPFTFCVGFKLDVIPSVKGAGEVILSQADGGGTGRNWLMVNSSDLITSFIGGSTDSGVTAVADTWYFVVVRYDGTNTQIYVNDTLGIDVARTPDEGATGDYAIGTKKTQDGLWADATINEILFFKNKALSTSELTNEYNRWRARL